MGTLATGGGSVANLGPDWHAVGTGDFNGDGKSDILWQNTSTGQVSIWEMDGNIHNGGGPVRNLAPSWQAVGTERRRFRHPVAEHERPNLDLADERKHDRRRGSDQPNLGPSWHAVGLT